MTDKQEVIVEELEESIQMEIETSEGEKSLRGRTVGDEFLLRRMMTKHKRQTEEQVKRLFEAYTTDIVQRVTKLVDAIDKKYQNLFGYIVRHTMQKMETRIYNQTLLIGAMERELEKIAYTLTELNKDGILAAPEFFTTKWNETIQAHMKNIHEETEKAIKEKTEAEAKAAEEANLKAAEEAKIKINEIKEPVTEVKSPVEPTPEVDNVAIQEEKEHDCGKQDDEPCQGEGCCPNCN